MSRLSVALNQYAVAGGGSGTMSSSELGELKKALAVGQLRGGDPASQSGGALKLESLEKTLKVLQFKESDLGLWMKVPKSTAFSTVEEYNQLTEYGDESGGFIGEGDLPEETDNSYNRVAELVKYIGTTRSTTVQAQLVNTNVGDLVRHQVETGTKWVLRKADRALFAGDANVVPKEWNGFLALQKKTFGSFGAWATSPQVIDLRGSHLTEAALEDAVGNIIEIGHGSPDLLIAGTAVLGNFSKQFQTQKLFQPTAEQIGGAIVGQRIKQYESPFGTLAIGYDKFMNDQIARLSGALATSPKAPAAPIADSSTPVSASTTDAQSKFATATSGDFFIGVAAINEFGISPITMLSNSAVTVAAGKAVDMKFTAGTGAYAATGFVIYRSERNPAGALAETPLYPILKVSATELANGFDGGAAGIIRDRDRIMPNTGKAIVTEASDECWGFKQLAPVMKMDLARTSTADRFMVLLFGTAQLYAPKRMTIVINAGKYVKA